MKQLKHFINESKIDYDAVLDALYYYLLDGYDFALDPSGRRTGSGAECLRKMGSIVDILEFHHGWEEIADECDVDEDEIYDFIYQNEKRLNKDLEQKL